VAAVEDRQPPAPWWRLAIFELRLGTRLPEDYRKFLVECNGGYVGGALWFTGPTPSGEEADAGVHHVGGLRKERCFSLTWNQERYSGRPRSELLWIMDDPFGNAICLGVRGERRGRVFFWDHENEPGIDWDGSVNGAANLQLLAMSFAEFVAGLHPNEDSA
jgi:SMI1-KNR4 cell-wall